MRRASASPGAELCAPRVPHWWPRTQNDVSPGPVGKIPEPPPRGFTLGSGQRHARREPASPNIMPDPVSGLTAPRHDDPLQAAAAPRSAQHMFNAVRSKEMAKIGPASSKEGGRVGGRVARRGGGKPAEANSPFPLRCFWKWCRGGRLRKGCAAGLRPHASEGPGVKYLGRGRPTRLQGVPRNSACPRAPPLAPPHAPPLAPALGWARGPGTPDSHLKKKPRARRCLGGRGRPTWLACGRSRQALRPPGDQSPHARGRGPVDTRTE
jgi:hypothetical protein